MDGRAKNGGARPGCGRKPSEAKKALVQILDESVPDIDRKEIFKALAERAKDGDARAAALLLGYLYGRPTERVELSGTADDVPPIRYEIIPPES